MSWKIAKILTIEYIQSIYDPLEDIAFKMAFINFIILSIICVHIRIHNKHDNNKCHGYEWNTELKMIREGHATSYTRTIINNTNPRNAKHIHISSM